MIRPAEYPFKVQIQEYVEWIFLHKKKLILYNLILLLMTIGVILFWPRQYRSEAKIWIKIGRENSHLDPTAATGETVSIQETDREDEIKSVLDIVASRGVVSDVVDSLGPLVVLGNEPLPGDEEVPASNFVVRTVKGITGSLTSVINIIDPVSDREDAIKKILDNVLVDAEQKSNVVSIVYDTKNPKLAQAIVSELVDQYTKSHGRIHSTAGSRPFFEEQLENLSSLVADSSEALRAEKDRIGLASINGQRMMLESQMMQTQEAKMSEIRNIAQSEASIAKLKKLIKNEPVSIRTRERSIPNTGRDMIRDQYFALQVDRMGLEARLKNHPSLDAIRKQEADAKSEFENKSDESRKEITRSINDIRQTLLLSLATTESRLVGQRAGLEAIEKQEVAIAKEISMLNRYDIEVKRLEREVELAVTNYRKYSANLEDARMSEALDLRAISNISVAQPATLEESPVSPSKSLVAALGMFGMLVGSTMIVVGSKMLSGPDLLPEEVSEAAEAPVLVAIPDRRKYRKVLK